MRVLIDTTFERRAPRSGTAVYLRELISELERISGVEVVPVASARRRPPAGGGVGSARNLLDDLLWTAVELPRLARRHRAEVIHHPLPAIAPWAPAPQVVTVMDLAFERLPECFDPRWRRWASVTHRLAARSAAAVISISHTTAADARELWRLDPQRIVVAPLGPGQLPPSREQVGSGPAQPEDKELPRHFLYVGDNEPRKDVPVLLEAYRRYRERAAEPLDLVLAGSAGALAHLRPGVRAVPAPTADELRALLSQAAALVQASRYEGFGLTPLEAMAAGTPVLAARAPATTEVCADAALYAAPGDVEGFTRELDRLAREEALRHELSQRGRRRAERFSWATCARAHAEAYSLAIRTPSA